LKKSKSFRMILGRKTMSKILQQIIMITMAFIALFPIYYMFVTTFKTRQEYHHNMFGPPMHFVLSNFEKSFRTGQQFVTWLLNSTIITFSSVFLGIVFASLAGYAFANMDFRGKKTLFNFTISIMVIPAVVMILPLFELFVSLGILNTRPSTIIIYVGLILPFCIYMLANFFVTIPQDILDAAKIDGCPHLKILWLIMLPLSKPVIITLMVVNAIWVWNELLIAMVFLQADNLKTLMTGIILFKSRNILDLPMIMSGMVVTTIPMFVLFILGIRYFMSGLYAGSIKG